MDKKIKQKIRFDNMDILLLLDNNKVFANNVVAVNSNGDIIWKINDILKIEQPSGNSVIKKTDERTLCVISTIGVLYEIDIENRIIVKTTRLG